MSSNPPSPAAAKPPPADSAHSVSPQRDGSADPEHSLNSGTDHDADPADHDDVEDDDEPAPDTSDLVAPVDPAEAERVRRDAKLMDVAEFTSHYVFARRYPLLRLITIFKDQFTPQEWDNISTDIFQRKQLPELYACVHIGVMRYARVRARRQDVQTVDHVVELLKKAKRIMVVSGAGISVSCGIPDFRSKNGIYSRLTQYDLKDPTDMFDLEYFRNRPETFYAFANEIYPSNFKPSPSHMFVSLLEQKGKLLRNYTQNIDNIEELAGVTRMIQCHGSFRTARCVTCGYQVPGNAIEEEIFAKTVPKCPVCPPDSPLPVIKPDIVFFGEQLPDSFHRAIEGDAINTDLLIAIGSSLKVAPVSNILRAVPESVPQIIINRELLPHLDKHFDVHLLGDADTIVADLCRRAGWQLDHPRFAELAASAPPQPFRDNVHVYEGGVVVATNWSDDEGGSQSDDEEDEDTANGTATAAAPLPTTATIGESDLDSDEDDEDAELDLGEAPPPRVPRPPQPQPLVDEDGANRSSSDEDDDDVHGHEDHYAGALEDDELAGLHADLEMDVLDAAAAAGMPVLPSARRRRTESFEQDDEGEDEDDAPPRKRRRRGARGE
ncbi:NAD-dependent histone deacetylase sir2 [Blastocladiella emersonii ATCC 22665]|nr:NAD-dependent histone deacetylase sir2 [Blastocladiella emersonii ATCC 22665]